MPTRRSTLAAGVALSVSLAGCTINIGGQGSSGSSTQQQSEPDPEPEPETETPEPTEAEADANEPSGRLSVLSMAPLDGYQVTAHVEMGDADGIVISHENEVLERVESSGRHRVAGTDDEDDKLMHYEEVEEGDRFRLVAGYDDDSKEAFTLAEEYAL